VLFSTSASQLDLSVKDLMRKSMSLSKELLLTNKVTKWEGIDSAAGSLSNFETRNMIVELAIVISIASQDTCCWSQVQSATMKLFEKKTSYLEGAFVGDCNEYKTFRSLIIKKFVV